MQKSIFSIDWNNLEEVIDRCKNLNKSAKQGFESCVVKVKGRNNFNITHTSQVKRIHGDNATIVWPPEQSKDVDEGFKGYFYTDKDGNRNHTWDYEESIGE